MLGEARAEVEAEASLAPIPTLKILETVRMTGCL
jgi:hypothetical protein